FQAEDGIRDRNVTGVQTCALPISHDELVRYAADLAASLKRIRILESMKANLAKFVPQTVQALIEADPEAPLFDKHESDVSVLFRSEERRVGKECRSWRGA